MLREKSSPTGGIPGVIEFRWPGRGPYRNRNQPRRISRRHRVTSFNYAYDIEPEEPIWWQKLALYMETCSCCCDTNSDSEEERLGEGRSQKSQRNNTCCWLDWRYVCCVNSWKRVKKSAEMNHICCCAPCKPRYRRLVDSIYPKSGMEGLSSSNMQKLIFYAISHPEKLERIGEYIVMRLARDLNRGRYGLVKNGVDAMDQLLQSCHSSPSLPQFSESHLRMVQKLLESSIPKLEQLATDSFVTFSNIEESSPSYHRQYDFFISKFSQMCHASSDKYGEEAMKIRCAGLRGLRGVVWKSVTDELHPNIWEPQHMDKIVPSILFNLQASFESIEKEKSPVMIFDAGFNNDDHEPEENAKSLSDRCLRELMGKASFASLRPVIEPVLTHMDLHTKWNPPPNFAVHVFRAIIYSIQSQNSYFVIQELINHLDKLCRAEANVRIGIATVLSNIVSIAGTSIGPLLLSIFSSLLRHLKTSVDYERSGGCKDIELERQYQEALINAMGDFANALPDYQKVEMMMFTVDTILPLLNERNSKQGDDFLIHVLVKTLLKVATKYRTAYLATVFTDSFLNTLIQLGLVADAKVRLIIQRIFHTLLDRHDNLMHVDKLPYVLDVADVQLTVEKCSRADQMFMRKHIADIAQMLYKAACMVSNDDPLNHLNAIQCTMSLLCIEAGFDETLIELFRLCLALQATAIEKVNEYSETKCAGIHNMIARYINLAAQLTANPSLCQHVQQVVSTRAQSGPHSMNLLIEDDDSKEAIEKQRLSEKDGKERTGLAELDKNGMLFLAEDIGESLKAAGKDISKLSLPFISTQSNVNQKTKGDVDSDSGDEIDGSKTPLPQTAGIDDVSVDLSVDWTPPPSNKHSRRNTVFSLNIPSSRIGTLGLPLNVDTLKSYASTPLDQEEEEKRANDLHFAVLNDIRTIPFEERVAAAEARSEVGELSKTVARLLVRNQEKTKIAEIGRPVKPQSAFDVNLPSFVF